MLFLGLYGHLWEQQIQFHNTDERNNEKCFKKSPLELYPLQKSIDLTGSQKFTIFRRYFCLLDCCYGPFGIHFAMFFNLSCNWTVITGNCL